MIKISSGLVLFDKSCFGISVGFEGTYATGKDKIPLLADAPLDETAYICTRRVAP